MGSNSKDLVPTKLSDEVRRELTDTRSEYTAEQKVTVAMAMMVCNGNSRKAAEMVKETVDILPNTIRQWKLRCAWWPTAEAQAKEILQSDLDRAYTSIIHKTEREILDRLENGDIYTYQGKKKRTPIDAKTLTYIHGIISDKRAQLRGAQLGKGGQDGQLETLYKIMNLLKEMSEQQREKVIEGDWNRLPEDVTGQD